MVWIFFICYNEKCIDGSSQKHGEQKAATVNSIILGKQNKEIVKQELNGIKIRFKK